MNTFQGRDLQERFTFYRLISIFELSNESIASTIAFTITLLTTSAFANDEVTNTDNGIFFGNARISYISSEESKASRIDSSAIGVKLGFISSSWHGFSAGGTLYSTQKLISDDNGEFVASDSSNYAILGEVFIQGDFANTQMKVGRFEFDSPHIDTDDIRMVPNTFSGAILTNSDIMDATFYLMYLNEWAGVGSETPEEFTKMTDDGITAFGLVYEGFENLGVQTWYYHAGNLTGLFYADAIYEMGNLTLGVQFGNQSNNNSGPDGDIYGAMASYTIGDFAVNGSVNKVLGLITNGFGGGPFFTNAGDKTIDGVLDQGAVSASVDYNGVENLTLTLLHVAFDEGADETDFIINYYFGNDTTVDFTYHDMQEDGKMLLAVLNVVF